jgi:hypothetical protein
LGTFVSRGESDWVGRIVCKMIFHFRLIKQRPRSTRFRKKYDPPPPSQKKAKLRTRVHFFQLPSPYFFGLPDDFAFDAAYDDDDDDDDDDDEGGNALAAG